MLRAGGGPAVPARTPAFPAVHPGAGARGARPRVLATLRNLVIGLIRQAGYTSIAGTIRQAEYDKTLLLAILRLTPAS